MRGGLLRKYGKKVVRRYVMGALPSGVVLLYHRVADLESDPQLLAVSPRNFAEHLEVLGQSYLPVRLGELRDHTHGAPRRTHPVALTFDDGYADNLYQGLPLLRAAGIPATAFIVTGQMGALEEFWWDELERILLRKPDLPGSLRLTIGSKQFSWHLAPAGGESDRRWNVLSARPYSPRQAAYLELCELLRPLSEPTRKQALDSLRDWADVKGPSRAHNRTLAEEEVVALAEDGLVEVGAHTVTHPLLSMQPVGVQKEEIERSKLRLEDILNARVPGFSYPYGGRRDYTSAAVGLVKEGGYAYACSNFRGRVYRGTDRFQMPRFIVLDWNGDEFARRLGGFFNG
jgi:peptidoglycan/xylan/chitin deacetylase (PgdA/CDA1 family)